MKLTSQKYVENTSPLNALNINLAKLLDFKEESILINSFVYSNFHYCALMWQIWPKYHCSKSEKCDNPAENHLSKLSKCNKKRSQKSCKKNFVQVFLQIIVGQCCGVRFIQNDFAKYLLNKPVGSAVTFWDNMRCLHASNWYSLPMDLKTCSD